MFRADTFQLTHLLMCCTKFWKTTCSCAWIGRGVADRQACFSRHWYSSSVGDLSCKWGCDAHGVGLRPSPLVFGKLRPTAGDCTTELAKRSTPSSKLTLVKSISCMAASWRSRSTQMAVAFSRFAPNELDVRAVPRGVIPVHNASTCSGESCSKAGLSPVLA